MTTENIKSELIILISTLFKEKGFDTELIEYSDLVNDVGMDSITFISMVVEIESHFNMEVPDDFLLMEYFKFLDDVVIIIADVISSKNKKGGSEDV